jgi:AcrR family transcriptional regulator
MFYARSGDVNKSESKYFNTATKMDLALMELLKKKPLEYITVSEICKTAGVNRSTFYLHYENIGDLLDETSRLLLDDFAECFSAVEQTAVYNLKNCDLNELVFISDKYLTPYLTYIKDRREVFKTAVLHDKTFGFEKVYARLFENIFNPILERFDYPADIRQYVMMYYLNGIHAIVLEWLKNDCDRSIKDVSEIITICIYGKENLHR